MFKKYNYALETGIVGTNDENIASILCYISQIEMRASFASSSPQKLDSALGELYFMITDSKVRMGRLLKTLCGKADICSARAIIQTLDESTRIVREARSAQDCLKKSAAISSVYEKLLAAIPCILSLDAKGRHIMA
jgi:hypothetical protein